MAERSRILYAPRMPADPFARSVFLRSLHSRSVLRQRHANAHTLGGAPPPKTPPPGTPPGTPGGVGGEGALRAPWAPFGAQGGPLIRNESYSEWNRFTEKTFVR